MLDYHPYIDRKFKYMNGKVKAVQYDHEEVILRGVESRMDFYKLGFLLSQIIALFYLAIKVYSRNKLLQVKFLARVKRRLVKLNEEKGIKMEIGINLTDAELSSLDNTQSQFCCSITWKKKKKEDAKEESAQAEFEQVSEMKDGEKTNERISKLKILDESDDNDKTESTKETKSDEDDERQITEETVNTKSADNVTEEDDESSEKKQKFGTHQLTENKSGKLDLYDLKKVPIKELNAKELEKEK